MNINIWEKSSRDEDFDCYHQIIKRSNRNITLTLKNYKRQNPKKNLDYENGTEKITKIFLRNQTENETIR